MSTLNIVNNKFSDVLNASCTYFRTSEVSPWIDQDGNLNIINGSGQSRSWGSPNVTSKVSELADGVLMVDVTGWHKHSVGPEGGNYYFVRDAKGNWKRTTANNKIVKAILSN